MTGGLAGFEARTVRGVHALVGGDGPPLLLLHGYPQTHVMWHRLAPELARTHTVVAGDSIWKLAKRYGVARGDLLARNGLSASAVLRPVMALKIDADASVASTAPGAPPAMPE